MQYKHKFENYNTNATFIESGVRRMNAPIVVRMLSCSDAMNEMG